MLLAPVTTVLFLFFQHPRSLSSEFWFFFHFLFLERAFFWILTWPSPYHIISGFSQMSPFQEEPSLSLYEKMQHLIYPSPHSPLHLSLILINIEKLHIIFILFIFIYDRTWAPMGSHLFVLTTHLWHLKDTWLMIEVQGLPNEKSQMTKESVLND